MLLITIIGLSHEMEGRGFVDLKKNIVEAIDSAIGERKMDEEKIRFFIPEGRVDPSWKGREIFIHLTGFYTQWMLSGSWPDERIGGLTTKAIEISAKKCLGAFNENVVIQCSILSESCTVTG